MRGERSVSSHPRIKAWETVMGKEDVGGSDVVVVEKIGDVGFEVIGVEDPSAVRDGDAELMFFIALAVERDETGHAALADILIRRTGNGFDAAGLDSSVRRRRGRSNEV